MLACDRKIRASTDSQVIVFSLLGVMKSLSVGVREREIPTWQVVRG